MSEENRMKELDPVAIATGKQKRGPGRPRKEERAYIVDALTKWSDVGFDGADVKLQKSEDIRSSVTRKAIECLPHVLRLAMLTAVEAEKTEDRMKALRFIKDLADGQISPKEIKVAATTWTDDQVLDILKDEAVDDTEI
jgi:hypothetical protein